ncbi:MAG: hypothetical protein GX796_06470 [Clostridiaceae bacterium]|nr:hypothetical protein [Clostridiaceae bacterium]
MIFKRKSRIALMVCTILSCIVLVVSSAAGAGQPGSDADPLVTKSYVDQKFAQLSTQIGTGSGSGSGSVDNTTIAQLQTDVGDLTKFIIDALTEIETLKAKVASLEGGYLVVEAKAGQKIILSGGSEALLRSGTAEAIKGVNGVVVDASSGKDLNDGVNVPVQHLLISSRTDGRGLLIKSNSYLLIRGAYTIK